MLIGVLVKLAIIPRDAKKEVGNDYVEEHKRDS